MLRLGVIFLVVALLAAFFGFGLVANLAFDAAKIMFFVFLILALTSLIMGYRRWHYLD